MQLRGRRMAVLNIAIGFHLSLSCLFLSLSFFLSLPFLFYLWHRSISIPTEKPAGCPRKRCTRCDHKSLHGLLFLGKPNSEARNRATKKKRAGRKSWRNASVTDKSGRKIAQKQRVGESVLPYTYRIHLGDERRGFFFLLFLSRFPWFCIFPWDCGFQKEEFDWGIFNPGFPREKKKQVKDDGTLSKTLRVGSKRQHGKTKKKKYNLNKYQCCILNETRDAEKGAAGPESMRRRNGLEIGFGWFAVLEGDFRCPKN